jgi:hypothetical protein
VGVAGEDDRAVAPREREQRRDRIEQRVADRQQPVLGVQPQVDSDLVVARAPGVTRSPSSPSSCTNGARARNARLRRARSP